MTPPLSNWLTALAVTLAVGVVAAQGDLADPDPTDEVTMAQQDAEALASREWVAQRVCNGRPFEWADDKTLVCHQEQQP
ncbi:MAG: hypothetical protein F9K35_06990 [Burkholderiaceae bacterium]|nr:MAG: hypothetical protein F9K35_06990 [Burkholderiaceae bacterium]